MEIYNLGICAEGWEWVRADVTEGWESKRRKDPEKRLRGWSLDQGMSSIARERKTENTGQSIDQ